MLPDRALCLPTFCHLLLAQKPPPPPRPPCSPRSRVLRCPGGLRLQCPGLAWAQIVSRHWGPPRACHRAPYCDRAGPSSPKESAGGSSVSPKSGLERACVCVRACVVCVRACLRACACVRASLFRGKLSSFHIAACVNSVPEQPRPPDRDRPRPPDRDGPPAGRMLNDVTSSSSSAVCWLAPASFASSFRRAPAGPPPAQPRRESGLRGQLHSDAAAACSPGSCRRRPAAPTRSSRRHALGTSSSCKRRGAPS